MQFFQFKMFLSGLLLSLVSLTTVAGQSTAHKKLLQQPRKGAQQPAAEMGLMAGEVSDSSALVQIRLTQTDKLVDRDIKGAWGVVEFTLQSASDASQTFVKTAHALPQRDFIARVHFDSLQPNTVYQCATRVGLDSKTMRSGPGLEFKTHPGRDLAQPVSFAVVTGMSYAKFHGENPIDQTQRLIKTETVTEMRQKWHEQFIQPRYKDLFAKVPAFWMVDDHDYRIDDSDNSGEFLPLPETGRRILMEQLPYARTDRPAARTYRTKRVSKDLQIWLVENRFYRSANAMPDGPDKTIWGAEQRQWLQQTLTASDATFKILISPTPMIGPDDLRKTDNHCDVGGFQHERDSFFKFLKSNGLDQQNFFIVCGDRHWQYHAVDSTGFEEFSCGALIDANSRLARMPGDPKGTDPDGLIKHLHKQTERSGGFLIVSCTPSGNGKPSLAFEFHDEKGAELYRCTK